MIAGRADIIRRTHRFNRTPGFCLSQYRYNLFLAESTCLHSSAPFRAELQLGHVYLFGVAKGIRRSLRAEFLMQLSQLPQTVEMKT